MKGRFTEGRKCQGVFHCPEDKCQSPSGTFRTSRHCILFKGKNICQQSNHRTDSETTANKKPIQTCRWGSRQQLATRRTNAIHNAWHLGPCIFHWSQKQRGNNAKWSSNKFLDQSIWLWKDGHEPNLDPNPTSLSQHQQQNWVWTEQLSMLPQN